MLFWVLWMISLFNLQDDTVKDPIIVIEEIERESSGLEEGTADHQEGLVYPPWCLNAQGLPIFPEKSQFTKKKHLVAAHIFVRINEEDPPELSIVDLLHWMSFHRYAGVEHVYLNDFFQKPSESLRETLAPLVESGFVTYILDEHAPTPEKPGKRPVGQVAREVKAKAKCFEAHGHEFEWLMLTDMDEYSVVVGDADPLFLSRALAKLPASVSQVALCNRIMVDARNYSLGPTLVQQIRHKRPDCEAWLQKPIFRASDFKGSCLHLLPTRSGRTVASPTLRLEMHHYWGARLNGWKPYDYQHLKNNSHRNVRDGKELITRSDFLALGVAPELLRCPISEALFPGVFFGSRLPSSMRRALEDVRPSWNETGSSLFSIKNHYIKKQIN